MDRTKVEKQLREYGALVEAGMERFLPASDCIQKNVCDAMRYSVMAGGKRIRPALLLGFYSLFREDPGPALPFACAVEMVHTYSLIHDDLPCMDNDDLRRGRPSCHVRFGEATALLAGDALLSLAFETALCNNDKGQILPENALRAAGELARASGAGGMVGGQIIDLESEGHRVSLQTLELMHRKKTGAMIVAPARMGCILAGAGEPAVEAAGGYAQKLGLAFQITDDILDVIGSDEALGKPVGSDSENAKSTYITHLGIEKSRRLVRKLTDEAEECLSALERPCDFPLGLAEYLARRDR